MKKKISLLLLAVICVFTIVGCGSKEDMEYDEATVTSISETIVGSFQTMDNTILGQFLEYEDEDLTTIMANSGLPISGEVFRNLVMAWQGATEECGLYEGHDDYVVEVDADSVTLTTNAHYSNRDAEVVFTFNEDLEMESVLINPDYTIGEILQKAGLNTLLGMGTVFAMLIFIAFIISLFKYIPAIEAKLTKKDKSPASVAKEEVKSVAPVVSAVSDDAQLIAVISAAIAASEGTTTDGFVVRSIRRKKSNQWNG